MKEFREWFQIPEHGYVKEKSVGNIQFSLLYTPTDYLISKELNEQRQYKSTQIQKIRESYDGGENFLLQVSISESYVSEGEQLLREGVKSFEEWNELVKALSFNIHENVFLICQGDTLEPVIHHFERGYELAQHQRFMFSFPELPSKDEFTFVFQDNYFKTGRNYFKFSDLEQIPELPVATI